MKWDFFFSNDPGRIRIRRRVFILLTYLIILFDNLSSIRKMSDFFKLKSYIDILINATYWYLLILLTMYIFSKFIIPKYLAQKRYKKLLKITIGTWIILFFIAINMAYIMENYINAYKCNCNYEASIVLTVFLSIYYTLVFIIPLSIYLMCFFFMKNIYTEQKYHTQLIKEKTEYELNLYQRKIHPEYFLYSIKALSADPITESSQTQQILLFSNILSFILYDGSLDKVPLTKEMEIAQDLVTFESSKQSQQLKLSVHFLNNEPPLEITPLKIVNPLIDLFSKNTNEYVNKNSIYVNELNCEIKLI